MSRLRIPLALPISIVALLILGAISGPLIRSNFPEEARAANVFLEAISVPKGRPGGKKRPAYPFQRVDRDRFRRRDVRLPS